MVDIRDRRWTLDELLRVRTTEVLTQRPTDLSTLESAFERHRRLPPHKRADRVLAAAKTAGRIAVQPRHGVSLVDGQIAAMNDLLAAGADLVSTLTDPYTRQLQFDRADEALAESKEQGRSLISGYPVTSYGVTETSRIVDEVEGPCAVRMASSDSRLAKEIYLASGFTAMFMGPLQNLAYEKSTPPERLISHYQYEDRLISHYEENGCAIVKEFPATLTGTLVPPCIAIACSLIDTLLAVRQGVTRVICNYGLLGNYVQDIAAIQALRILAAHYIGQIADDVDLSIVTPQWMGDFPQNEAEAYAVIVEGSLIAGLGGVDMVISKSLDEGFGVPSHEANVAGVVATRRAVDLVANQQPGESPEIAEEIDRITRSVTAILDRTLELGQGDFAAGACAAIRAGVIDVPFSPSTYSLGVALPARDLDGAVRWLDPGNIPLPDDVLAFHRGQVAERAREQQAEATYQFVIDDIFEFSKRLGPHRPGPPVR